MRLTIARAFALALLAVPSTTAAARAQGVIPQGLPSQGTIPGMAHPHIEQIWTAYYDTPGGVGLLPTGAAEAEIAGQHAALALRDSLYLEGMRRHVSHVLHALDPSLAPEGPGLGYGVRRATERILEHIRLAAAAEDASDNLRTHAEYITGAARSTLERIDRVVALARRLGEATTAAQGHATVRELEVHARAVWLGLDADRDGRVVWGSPEGGLRQVQQHMTLLRRGEGLLQEGFQR